MEQAMVEQVRTLVAPVVADHGLSLYDVEHTGGSLRVLVDREGGVDLEAIGQVTQAVSRLLDEHDPMPGRYTLEVSSPGLERPLRTPAHFTAAVGQTVAVRTRAGVEGDRRVEGTLTGADDHGVVVEAPAGARRLAFGEIERARTVFDWGPAPRPAGGGKGKRTKSSGAGSGARKRKATTDEHR